MGDGATIESEERKRDAVAYALACGLGLALWIVTATISGKREPWDSGVYWGVTYPLSIGLAAVLAWAFPVRPARWAFSLVFMQAVVMIAAGSGFSMLPPGLVLLAVLTIPHLLVGALAARLRRRLKAQR